MPIKEVLDELKKYANELVIIGDAQEEVHNIQNMDTEQVEYLKYQLEDYQNKLILNPNLFEAKDYEDLMNKINDALNKINELYLKVYRVVLKMYDRQDRERQIEDYSVIIER